MTSEENENYGLTLEYVTCSGCMCTVHMTCHDCLSATTVSLGIVLYSTIVSGESRGAWE